MHQLYSICLPLCNGLFHIHATEITSTVDDHNKFDSKRSRIIINYALRTKTIIIYRLGCKGAHTCSQCVFVECALCLQSLFEQNKTNVSFREMTRPIARNSLYFSCINVKSTQIKECPYKQQEIEYIHLFRLSSTQNKIIVTFIALQNKTKS